MWKWSIILMIVDIERFILFQIYNFDSFRISSPVVITMGDDSFLTSPQHQSSLSGVLSLQRHKIEKRKRGKEESRH